MFVLSLLFLVGFNKRLVVTISAFTLAHSLTLALSSLGLLTLRPPPVEATIALSIMLVAGEALNKEQTLSRRWPALVAFLFGLVHGLGFAGALCRDRPAAEQSVRRVAHIQCGRGDRSAAGGAALLWAVSRPGIETAICRGAHAGALMSSAESRRTGRSAVSSASWLDDPAGLRWQAPPCLPASA